MDLTSLFVPPLVMLTVMYGVLRYVFARRFRAWRAAAAEVGLENVHQKGPLGLPVELRGETDGLPVRLASGSRRDGSETCVAVDSRGRVPTSLSVRPEGLGATLLLTVGGQDLTVGDPGFDGEVYLKGPETLLLSLLDDQTRSALREVVGLKGRITHGWVHLVCGDGNDPGAIAQVIETALRAVRLLQPPKDVVARLAEIARRDAVSGVRRRCLGVLVREYAGHKLTREVCQEALQSPDGETRLLAAITLGDEGEAALIELAGDSSLQEDLVTRAITALGARLPLTPALALLDAALRMGRRATALAAIRTLAAIGDAAAAARLLPLLRQTIGELAAEAARALGAIHAPGAEASLVEALTSDLGELRLAAAVALGRVGGVDAVAPLRAAAAADAGLRRAARQAIEAIQSRVPDASPGLVSLAPSEAGEVSLAESSAGGRLTVARTPRVPE